MNRRFGKRLLAIGMALALLSSLGIFAVSRWPPSSVQASVTGAPPDRPKHYSKPMMSAEDLEVGDDDTDAATEEPGQFKPLG